MVEEAAKMLTTQCDYKKQHLRDNGVDDIVLRMLRGEILEAVAGLQELDLIYGARAHHNQTTISTP